MSDDQKEGFISTFLRRFVFGTGVAALVSIAVFAVGIIANYFRYAGRYLYSLTYKYYIELPKKINKSPDSYKSSTIFFLACYALVVIFLNTNSYFVDNRARYLTFLADFKDEIKISPENGYVENLQPKSVRELIPNVTLWNNVKSYMYNLKTAPKYDKYNYRNSYAVTVNWNNGDVLKTTDDDTSDTNVTYSDTDEVEKITIFFNFLEFYKSPRFGNCKKVDVWREATADERRQMITGNISDELIKLIDTTNVSGLKHSVVYACENNKIY